MIEVVSGFKFTDSTDPLDGRNNFSTLADMKNCEICDEGHITFCKATGKTYRFVSKNTDGTSKTKDSTYGYWEEFQPGGEGTITGATIGGNSVTKSGGILQFPAYPTVPISSIAKKTNDTNPITPNQGRVNLDLTVEDIAYNNNKTVKGKLNDIDKLIKDLTPDPSDNESSSTIIDLNLYSEWEDDESEYHSFIYDSSAIYVYSTSSTSQIKVESNNTPHAIFKVSDRDIYIDYIISTSGNDTIYTANAIYNSSILPSDFKKQFELGVYALIYRIIGKSGDNIPYGKTIIADTDNKVLNVVYRDVTDNNVTKHQLIARAFDKSRIYIYETPDATYTRGYKFKISYGTADSGFSDLNKLFGEDVSASDVSYNNSSSGLSATNVNDAIDETFRTLKHTSGSATVSSGSFTLPSTVTGNTYYDITSTPITSLTIPSVNSSYEVVIKFTTHSTNTCTVTIPNNQKYIGDFSVGTNTTYIISIFNGVIIIAETETYTNS